MMSPLFSSGLAKIHCTPYMLFQLVTLKSIVFKRGSFSSSSTGDVDLGIWKSEMRSFSSIHSTGINCHYSYAGQWFMLDVLKTGYPQACCVLQESLASLPNSQILCSLWHACLSLICFLRFPQRTFTRKAPQKAHLQMATDHEEDLHKDVAPEHINFPFPEV